MGGRITHLPEPEHPCDLPNPIGMPAMTVWECDDCGSDWLLIPPASLSVHRAPPSLTWWVKHPGMPESGYRPFLWPWQRRKR